MSRRERKYQNDKNWQRILWKRQPFPDNYVSPSRFLESLRKNSNFVPYTYAPLVLAATSVCQHVANIFTFLSVFIRLKEKTSDPRVVIWISIFLFITGYLLWEMTSRTPTSTHKNEARSRVMRSSILVFMALLALSPVLRTLTQATSSDSIWALSFFLFALHTLLADYTDPIPYESRERLTSVLSMNAAISSSVVLASRLDSDIAVFSLTLLAVQAFALFPLLRRQLHHTPMVMRMTITSFLSSVSISLMGHHSTVAGLLTCFILVFVTFFAPAVLVWAQRYKNEIRGEWDVAVPDVSEE
ncbi:hypothetical protein FRC14_005675 [Serendipita sp. 396]|nr:hypothetical protein FRC14_005675 [Serendipita sp. 396]KAG8787199.1 hypothetical protein FRC15_009782 [Serendipita sp. 397]KAG8822303.1 hypothetical protein FRC19_006244 [Serendipita sp. 401]KAG8823972.1 hypothetical protein FRC18_010609 [Serendipita sp. 400]KAG9054145.1 hypothetical protein FS842_006077 [Serendipita sp. 407]